MLVDQVSDVAGRIARREVRYGVPSGDFLRRLEAQRFRCADCLKSFESASAAQYDHDHRCCPGERACGRCIRGLVCNDCNWLRGVADKAGCNYVVLERLATLAGTKGGVEIMRRSAANLRTHAGVGPREFPLTLDDLWEQAIRDARKAQ